MTTVPTTGALPVPHTSSDIPLALDRATNLADLARGDLSRVMQDLPDSTALWVHVDLVRAARYLRLAAVLIDKSADQIDAKAVAR